MLVEFQVHIIDEVEDILANVLILKHFQQAALELFIEVRGHNFRNGFLFWRNFDNLKDAIRQET